MKKFLVDNTKGGSGKTTLATNLAGYLSSRGLHVALSDMDRQASSLGWLERRPVDLPIIHGLNGRSGHLSSMSAHMNVIDSPAGLRGEKLSDAVKAADWVIVPMQSSSFDINATQDFLEVLKEEKSVRKGKAFVAMVGMRVDRRTKSAARLEQYLAETDFPVKAYLSDAQIYQHCAEIGATIFDMQPSKANKHIAQWVDLLSWLEVYKP